MTEPNKEKPKPKQTMAVARILGQQIQVSRTDETGKELRAFKATVDLTPGVSFVAIQDKVMATKKGVDEANKWAALSVQLAEYVVVDGVRQHNPYIVRNPKTGAIMNVYVLMQAGGHAPSGQIVISQASVYFNIYSYFMQDLMAKINKFPMCGCVGIRSDKPKLHRHKGYNDNAEKEHALRDTLVFYEVEGELGIWVDYTSKPIADAVKEHTQRQKFGDRIAQSIAERNAMMKHPAMGGFILKRKGEGYCVDVYGSVPVDNRLKKTMAKARAGEDISEEAAVIDVEFHEIKADDAETVNSVVEEAAVADGADATHAVKPDAVIQPEPEDPGDDFGGGEVFGETEQPTEQKGKPPADAKPAGLTDEEREHARLVTDIYTAIPIVGEGKAREIMLPLCGGKKAASIKDTPTLKKILAALNKAADEAV